MKNNPLIDDNMTVAVLGLGVSGSAAVRYLHALGVRVKVSDKRPFAGLSAEERQLVERCACAYEGGNHTHAFLGEASMLVLSPGVPRRLPVLENLEKKGMAIIGELALAAPVLEKSVIAVSGTNGKTTVTTLIGEILADAGRRAAVCGNIGRPLLDCLCSEEPVDFYVIEVSSFQLDSCGAFRPDIGLLLNISPDHLDHHGSFADYVQAKAKLFVNQSSADSAILNGDDVFCCELGSSLATGIPLFFGHKKESDAYICESEVYVREGGRIHRYELADTAFANHIGRQNCAAAILAAHRAGIPAESIQRTIRSFRGLPHRLELVEIIDGVRYYNDSKATNTGAVISALRQVPGEVVLIAGGRDKGDDYTLLRPMVAAKVKHLLLLGEAAPIIARSLRDTVPHEEVADMEEALQRARALAQEGDSVLLSPACASFDMFESYGHRGKVFRDGVAGLRQNSSTPTVTRS